MGAKVNRGGSRMESNEATTFLNSFYSAGNVDGVLSRKSN